MDVVHDLDRPDVGGVPPKMLEVCKAFDAELKGMTPYIVCTTNDNLMSNIHIRGSLVPKGEWAYGIFQNSPYFQFHVVPMDGKRYYDPSDPKVTVELIAKGYKLGKFRKYTGPVERCIAQVKKWLESQTPAKGA